MSLLGLLLKFKYRYLAMWDLLRGGFTGNEAMRKFEFSRNLRMKID